MPEAIPVETPEGLDDFTRAYLQCAAWSSSEGERGEIRIDDLLNRGAASWAPETIARAVTECREFQDANAALLAQVPQLRGEWSVAEQNGHDFWLTRNGHGTGFWDRDYPGTLGDDLTKSARRAGERWLYLGDDGNVYYY